MSERKKNRFLELTISRMEDLLVSHFVVATYNGMEGTIPADFVDVGDTYETEDIRIFSDIKEAASRISWDMDIGEALGKLFKVRIAGNLSVQGTIYYTNKVEVLEEIDPLTVIGVDVDR